MPASSDRAADRGQRVRHQQVLGRHESRYHRLRGRQEEPVHRQDDQRACVEHDRCMHRIEQHQPYERRLDPRRDREDATPRPAVDEHAGERPDDGERHGDDHRGLEQPHRRALLVRGEDDRRDQRDLEEPVRELAGHPHQEQTPEVGTAERATRALERAPRRHGGHRRACGAGGPGRAGLTARARLR